MLALGLPITQAAAASPLPLTLRLLALGRLLGLPMWIVFGLPQHEVRGPGKRQGTGRERKHTRETVRGLLAQVAADAPAPAAGGAPRAAGTPDPSPPAAAAAGPTC